MAEIVKTRNQVIDGLVAVHVMGWHEREDIGGWWSAAGRYQFGVTSWRPSTWIELAWQVVEKMKTDTPRRHHPDFTLWREAGVFTATFVIDDHGYQDRSDTAPMAICLAALQASGVDGLD